MFSFVGPRACVQAAAVWAIKWQLMPSLKWTRQCRAMASRQAALEREKDKEKEREREREREREFRGRERVERQ